MVILLLLYLAFSLIAICFLLSSPYLRITSLGWFITILAIPFIGAMLFVLTVIRSKKTGQNTCFQSMLAQEARGQNVLEQLGIGYSFLPYYGVSDSELLRDNAFLDCFYSCIDDAKKRIWISTYILSGGVKDDLIEKLTAAHNRGVEVLLLVDRIGSGLVLAPNDEPLKVPGVPFNVAIMHDSRIKSIFFMEKRLHSKILIADDVAIVGAHNLRDEILDHQPESVKNISLKFRGSVVTQLEAVFSDLWNKNSSYKIDSAEKIQPEMSEIDARIIFSDPVERSHAYNGYLTVLFNAARTRICIWMPYVVPTQSMRSTIIAASKIGLDVRVLVPEKTDSFLVDNAHALVIKEFVDNGVQCARSKGKFDHSKIMIIDNLSIIGSTNLDYRSLYRNYEANIEIHNEDFSKSLLALFDQEYGRAEVVKSFSIGALKHMKNQFTSLIAALY